MRIFSNILDQAERQAEINTHGDAGRRRAAEQLPSKILAAECRELLRGIGGVFPNVVHVPDVRGYRQTRFCSFGVYVSL